MTRRTSGRGWKSKGHRSREQRTGGAGTVLNEELVARGAGAGVTRSSQGTGSRGSMSKELGWRHYHSLFLQEMF